MEPIPSPLISADLKVTYGAKGDGRTDDTQALLDAVDDAVPDQLTVLYLPPGRYLISNRIDINKRVILRGAGRNLTTLVFTKSMTDLGTAWTGNSPHTYGPALLNWWGTGRTDATSLIARVTRCGSKRHTCSARDVGHTHCNVITRTAAVADAQYMQLGSARVVCSNCGCRVLQWHFEDAHP